MKCDDAQFDVDEESFRWAINEDPMAVDKIAEGIRLFSAGKGDFDVRCE